MKKTLSVNKKRIACKKKFLRFFKGGFADAKYYAWERGYKWEAHLAWGEQLNIKEYKRLLSKKKYSEIALRAVRLETKTNLLFSFEKMALRDAVKSAGGAKAFALGLYGYIYGKGSLQTRLENFAQVLGSLPRKQTRVLTWPLLTVFGFIAKPDEFIFLKPKVTKAAAIEYDFNFYYKSKPNWETYLSLIEFAETVRQDTRALKPKDYIDLQSFIWVLGSSEYEE